MKLKYIMIAALAAAAIICRLTGRLNAFVVLPMFAVIVWLIVRTGKDGLRAMRICAEGGDDDD